MNDEGRTALHLAALKGDAGEVRRLLSGGANPNLQCDQGWTPLHCATQLNSAECVSLLLAHGATLDLRDRFGNTALWRAVMASKGEGAVIAILLEAGANRDLANDSGVSPVALAARIGNYDIARFFKQ